MQVSLVISLFRLSAFPYRNRVYGGVHGSFYICTLWPGGIGCAPTSVVISITDNSGASDKGDIIVTGFIISRYISVSNISFIYKAPIIGRYAIPVETDTNIQSWSKRSPAVISVTLPPGYPGRAPLCSGHPKPSIGIIISPATIMECSPAPGVIGNPGPPIGCIHPMPFGRIGSEIGHCAGNPNIAVLWVVHPLSVWSELVIKDLCGYRLRRRRSGLLGFLLVQLLVIGVRGSSRWVVIRLLIILRWHGLRVVLRSGCLRIILRWRWNLRSTILGIA